MNDLSNFILELADFYDEILSYRSVPSSLEIKKEMDVIASNYGMENYRTGTNRIIYRPGNGYVYKCTHEITSVEDNIQELNVTNWILNHGQRGLEDHFALGEKMIKVDDQVYQHILEEEEITPIHDFVDIGGNESEGDASLKYLIEHYEAYETVMNIVTRNFVVADVSPRSIFNFGIKETKSGKSTLAILDYGYFAPKEGELICPECRDGILEYEIMDLNLNEKISTIINTVKATVSERYICSNASCTINKDGIIATRIFDEYLAGNIIVDDSSFNRSNDRDRRRRSRGTADRRENRRSRRGYNR